MFAKTYSAQLNSGLVSFSVEKRLVSSTFPSVLNLVVISCANVSPLAYILWTSGLNVFLLALLYLED